MDSATDLRANFPRFTPEAIKANMPIVEMLNNIAKRKNVSAVQIALSWLLAQKSWIVPIPGMDKMEYIEANIKFADVELTAEDLDEIDLEMAKITLHGARLDAGLLSLSED